jgi:tRNA G26 N,N-dimethylase Trm1
MTAIYKACKICGERYKTKSPMWGAEHKQRDICINCKGLKLKKQGRKEKIGGD